jgi:hypothetical protein
MSRVLVNRLVRNSTSTEGLLRILAIGACLTAYFFILLLAVIVAGGLG